MTKMSKTAQQLGLPTGDAVLRNGKVSVLPPGHALDGHRKTDIGPAQLPQMPASAGSQVVLKTTYADRAQGYLIGSVPMWLAFVVGAALIAYFMRDVPLLSTTMIGWMFTGAILSWVFSWVIHTLISPDGTTIIHALLGYRIIRHEQRFRQEMYRDE